LSFHNPRRQWEDVRNQNHVGAGCWRNQIHVIRLIRLLL
jgi:hypothetical protein